MRLSIPHIAARPYAAVRSHASWRTALLLAAIFAVALPLLWLSLTAVPRLHIEVGEWGDEPFLTGVNKREDNASETYRWTGEVAQLTLPNLGDRYRLLSVRAHGWRPPGIASPKVRVAAAGQTLAVIQTTPGLRTYSFVLPKNAGTSLTVEFTSELYRIPNDRRDLGFAIDWVELSQIESAGGPAAWQFGGQALGLLLAFVLLYGLHLPRMWVLGTAALLAGALLAANAAQPLWISAALPAWLLVVAALLAATWLVQRQFARLLAPWMQAGRTHIAWALFMAALALRLLGATHPLFNIHDLGFHTNWLADVTQGQLYIFSTPSEFQNRPTFNPPDGYLLLLPLRLLMLPTRLVIQVGLALVDALGGLLLLAIGRELGLAARASLLALALYAALPINMTMMWWGFATNALAQSAGLLVVWLLLRLVRRPTRARQAAFAAACAAGLLMHVGALVLIAALLGACALLGWRRLQPESRRTALAIGALALSAAVLLYFSAVLPATLGQPGRAGRSLGELLAQNWAVRDQKLTLIWLGLLRGFLPLPLALAPLGFIHLLKFPPRHPLGQSLVVGWLAVCLLFFGVYMGLGLVVRFLYFAAPLLCLALGALLGSLWRRRGRWVVIALVLLVAWGGAALWATGVLQGVRPSGVPLTY